MLPNRAVFDDPETGQETYVTLDLIELSTIEARRDWGIKKSKALAKRRMDIEAGAPRHNRVELDKAADDYIKGCKKRLRANTVSIYQKAAEELKAWCERQGITHTTDLAAAQLARYREHLISLQRKASVKGGKRGERKSGKARLAASSVNMRIRATSTMVGQWRTLGMTGYLTRDNIRDALKPISAPREQPEYLSTADLAKLLQAALAHDEAVFAETRAEHRGEGIKGTTRKHDKPIAAFTAFLLLTGCRRNEALHLK